MANESKERKTTATPANSPAYNDAGEIIFPVIYPTRYDPSAKPEARARCLEHLKDLDSSANQDAIRAIDHDLDLLDNGLLVLINSNLSSSQKQTVFNCIIANPYYAEAIATIATLLHQLGGDFAADFATAKEIIFCSDPAAVYPPASLREALKKLNEANLLTTQHKKDWFDFVMQAGRMGRAETAAELYVHLHKYQLATKVHIASLKKRISKPEFFGFSGFSSVMMSYNVALLEDPLLKQAYFDLMIANHYLDGAMRAMYATGLLKPPMGEFNLAQLKKIAHNVALAAAVSQLCQTLRWAEPNCLTQDNLNLLFTYTENPAMHVRLQIASEALRLKEKSKGEEVQDFFICLMKTPSITEKESKDQKENKADTTAYQQSLSRQKMAEVASTLLTALPEIPNVLNVVISEYAGDWYTQEDNDQLSQAEQYAQEHLQTKNKKKIAEHAREAVTKGWMGTFAYYLEKGLVGINDTLLEGIEPEAISSDLLTNSTNGRWYALKEGRLRSGVTVKFSTYFLLAVDTNQFEMVRMMLERYKPDLLPEEEEVNQEKDIAICRFGGSALQKAIVAKDVSLVRLLVQYLPFSTSDKCPKMEQPLGTTVNYGVGYPYPIAVKYPNHDICYKDYLQTKKYKENPPFILSHAAALWKSTGDPRSREIFEILLSHPCFMDGVMGTACDEEKAMVNEAVAALVHSQPLQAPQGRVGFHPAVFPTAAANAVSDAEATQQPVTNDRKDDYLSLRKTN